YFVGRIDSANYLISQSVLPTNKITHTLVYDNNSYSFKKDEIDTYLVLPKDAVDSVFTNDSTNVKHVMNEFVYSFFLRAKGNSFFKNELKINAGIRHDFYKYLQVGKYRDSTDFYRYRTAFQNVTILGSLGYRFSNRVDFNLDVQQILQGENAGDFLYEAKSNLLLSNAAGRIVLGAYVQNKSPEEIFNRYYGNHHHWTSDTFDRTKTVNLAFNYLNDKFNIDASANYYLITNYLYFAGDTLVRSNVVPTQENSAISLLKLSLGKRFTYRSFHLDSYVVYQKTDYAAVLRTPVFYTFNSLYKEQTFFKALKTQIGIDVRYNSTYNALSYAPAVSQFYNGAVVKLGSKPVVDVWVKAGLRRANLFLKYDYANQGLFSNGYYTVNRYPMPDRMLKFGVSWNFYD
ncbi:MAG: putative porin, partial [Pedobacter sp.]|nr:putative porin [Pedobacter sp.]